MSHVILTNLSRLRTQAGLSQRALAKTCGVSFNVIRRLEAKGDADHISLGTLSKIAAALSCEMLDLVEPVKESPPPAAPRELAPHEAALLRRVHRGDGSTRTLSTQQRQFVVPALIRMGLLETDAGTLQVSELLGRNLQS